MHHDRSRPCDAPALEIEAAQVHVAIEPQRAVAELNPAAGYRRTGRGVERTARSVHPGGAEVDRRVERDGERLSGPEPNARTLAGRIRHPVAPVCGVPPRATLRRDP